MMMTNNTAHARACCLDRWTCYAGGETLPRGEMSLPCGFEICGTVEGCPTRNRTERRAVDPEIDAVGWNCED